jgi:hypothetical protein
MTIKECIDIVDNVKPNQYGIKEKVMWLSFVDETIINDVLKTHEGYDGRYDDFTGYTEDKLSIPLIVPSPYDRLYPQYIKMMIDSENGETARYNNSSALYNTYLNEYKKYYNKTHMPLNATQKIPSPVSININSALSDAQIEYIKRQLYYMLSQDVGEVISPDKLYGIVTNYVLNNLEMIRANDGKDGKDGKDGTLLIPFKFDVDIKKGEKKQAEFDFTRNIFRFGNNTYDDLDKNDFPNIYEWAVGDFLVSNNGNVLLITRFERLNSEMLNFDAECILEAETIVVDQTYNPASSNPVSGRAIREVFAAMDMYKANTDLSNVDNDVFAAKAEEAGIGNAGLTEEKCIMEFMGVVTELPDDAEEGQVYKLDTAWKNLGSFSGAQYNARASAYYFAVYMENGLPTPFEHIIENFVEGTTYIFDMPESRYTYANCSHIESGVEMQLYGELQESFNDESEYLTDEVTVYEYDTNATSHTYVRFNGEWVEL